MFEGIVDKKLIEKKLYLMPKNLELRV